MFYQSVYWWKTFAACTGYFDAVRTGVVASPDTTLRCPFPRSPPWGALLGGLSANLRRDPLQMSSKLICTVGKKLVREKNGNKRRGSSQTRTDLRVEEEPLGHYCPGSGREDIFSGDGCAFGKACPPSTSCAYRTHHYDRQPEILVRRNLQT